MKYLIIIVCLLTNAALFAQIPEVKEKKLCYERYDSQGEIIPKSQQQYAEWQCGKLAGVIDCNEKLTYDEDSDIISSGNFGSPFTGRCETCHMNGIIERSVTFVDGKRQGRDTSFYKTGCTRIIQSNIQGVQSGQWFYFYDSTGYLSWENNYQLGEKHGKQIFFTAEGDTTLWENYTSGNLHGTKRTYYSKSRIKNSVNYNNGVLEGAFQTYNLKGVIIQDILYKQGKKHEEAKYYYDDGTLLKVGNYDMGVKDGKFTTFYYQQDPQVEENYRRGVRVGWFNEYYPTKLMKQKILYDKKGVRIEEHRYDEQGRETYAFGTPDSNGAEDDEVPGSKETKAQKKARKKKEKAAKKAAKLAAKQKKNGE
ncbi:MAG: antitoxin component YwqK of YwqJK toxin-antitoxin module [Flavobacteriaceae bacterium]|jgi:antitoxin component YwqK of YwqJK toxin-antitoxin module